MNAEYNENVRRQKGMIWLTMMEIASQPQWLLPLDRNISGKTLGNIHSLHINASIKFVLMSYVVCWNDQLFLCSSQLTQKLHIAKGTTLQFVPIYSCIMQTIWIHQFEHIFRTDICVTIIQFACALHQSKLSILRQTHHSMFQLVHKLNLNLII